MRALTLYQPWASLTALGVKTIETRGWSTKYRGPLLIHAGKHRPQMEPVGDWCAMENPWGAGWVGQHYASGCPGAPDDLPMPLGAVVATCTLADAVPILRADEELPVGWMPHVAEDHAGALRHWKGQNWAVPEVQCTGRLPWKIETIEDQRPYGDFRPGRYAWILSGIKALPEPIPARGRQGLWTPDADLLAALDVR